MDFPDLLVPDPGDSCVGRGVAGRGSTWGKTPCRPAVSEGQKKSGLNITKADQPPLYSMRNKKCVMETCFISQEIISTKAKTAQKVMEETLNTDNENIFFFKSVNSVEDDQGKELSLRRSRVVFSPDSTSTGQVHGGGISRDDVAGAAMVVVLVTAVTMPEMGWLLVCPRHCLAPRQALLVMMSEAVYDYQEPVRWNSRYRGNTFLCLAYSNAPLTSGLLTCDLHWHCFYELQLAIVSRLSTLTIVTDDLHRYVHFSFLALESQIWPKFRSLPKYNCQCVLVSWGGSFKHLKNIYIIFLFTAFSDNLNQVWVGWVRLG